MEYAYELPANCPPDNAIFANGKYYRLVKTNLPKQKDFLPQPLIIEKYKNKINNCKWMGISVYTSINSIIEMQSSIPIFRKRIIAIGHLNKDHGKIANSKDNHHNLYYFKNIIIEKIFRVVE